MATLGRALARSEDRPNADRTLEEEEGEQKSELAERDPHRSQAGSSKA
jgi:hypothetical protein